MSENKEKTYNQAIDALRIISILAVILIHTTTKIIQVSDNNLSIIPSSLFYNQASRFAVPLFFMISGFVLELNYSFHQNYFSYLKKRLSKILIPYIFWSAIYYYFIYTYHSSGFVSTLFQGSASYQLYFIPSLLIFYLIFPLIHQFNRYILNKWFLIVLGFFQLFLLIYDYYFKSLPFFYPLSIVLLNYFIFLLGVLFSHHQTLLITTLKKYKIYLFLLSIILAIYLYFEGKYQFQNTNNYLSFYSQWRPSVFIYTLTLAGSFYYFFNKSITQYHIIKVLSRLSFFVFFIHILVLELSWKYLFSQFITVSSLPSTQFFIFDLLFLSFIAFISFGIANFVHKIPLLTKITG